MKPARLQSLVVLLLLITSPIVAGQKTRLSSDGAVSAQKKLGALAARYEGKLSPRLLEAVSTNPQTVEVIVLLHEPEVVVPLTTEATDALKVYMAAAERDIEAVLNSVSTNLKTQHRYLTINGFAAEVTTEALEQLARHPSVKMMQPNYKKRVHRVEGNALMKVSAVHTRAVRGAGVTVAVIDDGVDYSHPELGGTPIGSFPNNVVIGGFDFVANVPDPSPFPQNSSNSHGTSVAGIIAGRGDARGGSGAAPEAKIVGLRAGNQDGISTAATIASLDWIVQNRTSVNPAIRVVNMSYGGEPFFPSACNGQPDVAAEEAAITRASNAGVVLVASAGNEGLVAMGAPACFSQVISVGAVYDANIGPQLGWSLPNNQSCDDFTTAADKPTCYSNVAPNTTVYGPSHNAFSPMAGGGYDETFGGTSAASPYTAGTIALLLSKFPNVTASNVRSALTATGKSITEAGITTPRVDIDAAYRQVEGTGGTPPTAPCVPSGTTLCLNNNRFRIQTSWRTSDGQTGTGGAVSLTSDTGYFWFFSPTNVEMVIKVLDACVFGNYWVFAGGLTDVNVITTVTDTKSGAVKVYENPLGRAFQPVQDTGAFATCP